MKLTLLCVFAVLIAAVSAYPRPQSPIARDGAPGYGKQPDGYFQYVNVPAHKEYEFGWNRGHPNHYISRYEQSKDHRFRTRVRWGDAHDGYDEHYWEYNHGPSAYKEPVHHNTYVAASDQVETVETAPESNRAA